MTPDEKRKWMLAQGYGEFISDTTDEEIAKMYERATRNERLLHDPNLLNKLIEECHKKIVREDDTIKAIILFKCGELVENCTPTSFNLFLSEESGVGKDHVLRHTLELFPKECREHRAKISPEVLAYWHNADKEPEWTWDRKSLYLEEVSGSFLDSDTHTAYSSQANYEGIVLVNQKPIELKVNGKPVMFITTASKNPKYDLLRRYAFTSLDDSVDQTKAIIKKQWTNAEKDKKDEYDDNITKALQQLKRVSVKIPFADKVGDVITAKYEINKILRTTNSRFIDLIKASAALHQYQRDKDSNGYVLATADDYENATAVFKKITQSISTVPITKEKKKLLNIIRKMDEESNSEHVTEATPQFHTASEIEPKATFVSKPTLYERLRELANDGYLESELVEREDKKERVYKAIGYKFKNIYNLELPTKAELLNSVNPVNSVNSVKSVNSVNSVNTIGSIRKTEGGLEIEEIVPSKQN
jgi:hypothetical protein